MLDAFAIDLDPEAQCQDVGVIILKILGDAGDERRAHHEQNEWPDSAKKLRGRKLLELLHVSIEDSREDHWIDEREERIDRRQAERQKDELAVSAKIS